MGNHLIRLDLGSQSNDDGIMGIKSTIVFKSWLLLAKVWMTRLHRVMGVGYHTQKRQSVRKVFERTQSMKENSESDCHTKRHFF